MRPVGTPARRKGPRGRGSSPGGGIDLGRYVTRARPHAGLRSLADLPGGLREGTRDLGLSTGEGCRSGSFLQVDHSVLYSGASAQGLQVMSLTEAVRELDGLPDYLWSALPPGTDRFTELVRDHPHHGFFIRTQPGARVDLPLQACLYMTERGIAQNVHNIIVAEEGSRLNIIAGCGSAPAVGEGLHVGVTEYYVKRGATLTYTMIHAWGREMTVRPRSAAVVEEGGVFMSNFVSLGPVRDLQMDPRVTCSGEGATARLSSILHAAPDTRLDVGGRVFLEGAGCRAEIVSRAITTGGRIVARGHVTGAAARTKAHLECRGLILAEEGVIHAVPELEGLLRDVDLSHEAAVGRLDEEQISYLMARGLTAEEATAAIVRGFLDVRIEGLPPELAERIRGAVDAADIGGI